jgi:phosphoglycerate dehydrogenase-like enzyme
MSNHSASIEQQKEEIELGIIGMGDMGRMYANRLSQHGWKRYFLSCHFESVDIQS